MKVAAAAFVAGILANVVWAGQADASIPKRPLVTGVSDPRLFLSPQAPLAFRRVRAAGATTVRLVVNWASVAPAGAQTPAGFDATDPADPGYSWGAIDREVKLARAAGLDPLLNVSDAPRWAQPESSPVAYQPDPLAFGQFAHALATRYSGQFFGLPRVKYWEVWNEPNITTYLLPQWLDGRPFSPGWYRTMVNAFSDAVHGVVPGNVVVAGALAPFRDAGVTQVADWGPLAFLREMLCISRTLKPTCRTSVSFDVLSVHPYTSGRPDHHAYRSNDVSLGDLPELRRTLAAAIRAGHVHAPHGVGLWATEFSWDSAPPDPEAVPMQTLRQWVPMALHALWQNGFTRVIWFRLRDDPMSQTYIQSGLYFNGGSVARDRPKPILANFRFPVVIVPRATGIVIWGRTPPGVHGPVNVQTRTTGGWRTIGTLRPVSSGIFQGALHPVSLGDDVRAVSGRTTSGIVPVTPIPDHFYNPFGSTSLLEPG